MLRYLSIILVLLTARHLRAADGTWTGATGGNWSDTTKWSAAIVANGSGSTANFNTLDPSADVTVRLDGDRTLTNLVFGDTDIASAASWILDNNGNSANNLILAGTTPTITVHALGAGKTTTISAVVQGSASLAKAGAGVLVLGGANTYTGTTDVTAGILNVVSLTDYGVAGSLGARTAVSETATGNGIGIHLNGGTLQFTGGTAQSTNRQIRIINGTSPAIDASGTGSGTISFTFNGTNTNLFDTPGTRTLNLIGSNTGNNLFAIGLTDQSVNATSLVKDGGGTWVISGNNTHTGATEVRGGKLKLGSASALGNGSSHTSGLTVTGGGILDLGGFSPTALVPLTLNSNANAFDVGAFLNSGASAVTYGGAVTLMQQTRFGGTGAMLLTGAITGNGVKLIKDSTGLLELQNSGTVTLGAFQANRGTLQVDGGTTLNVTSIDVGTGNNVSASLTLNGGSVTSTGLSRFGQGLGSASGTLNLNSGTLTVPALTKGSLTFNVNFNGGTLKAGGNSTTFLAAATNAKVKSGGAFIDDGGFAITIGHSLVEDTASTGGGFTKSGNGILTLNGANTWSGPTIINGGTLVLGTSGSLAATQSVSIASGARFDLSAKANFVWPDGIPLVTSGGDLKGGVSMDLGASPITLNFTPTGFTGDSSHPALTISTGALTLNGALTISNNSATPLGDGTYVIISQASGSISGSPTFSGTVTGQGMQAGKSCEIRINGGNLELVVATPQATTTTLSRNPGTMASSVYGNTLQFVVNVSPSAAYGTVQLFDGGLGGTLIGTGELSGGSCVITPADNALAPGPHSNLVARYLGTALYFASTSTALSPAQSVSIKPLTLASAVALDKYYDTTNAAAISGTLTGVENGDSVTLTPTGTFASVNPGTNIAVTSTATLTGASAARYSFTQPTGLSADIIAASVWTGGAGNTGTNVATGTNYNPTASTANVYNAIFNGLDPATTDLTLGSVIGGAVGTNGMVFGFAGNQTNPVAITGSTGASARVDSVSVASGAGAVTFQGALPFTIGGAATHTSHFFTNESANPLLFDTGCNWIPGNSGAWLRSLTFCGAGNITMRGNIAPSPASRMSLAKSGAGILTLSGANTFSGGTTLNEGEIIATTSTALGAGAVANNGTLDLTAGAVTYTGLSNSLSGNGAINVTLGTGTATTILNGNYSAFAGTWNIGIGAATGAGKVQMNGLDNASATIHVLENATLYTTSGTHNATLYLHGGNTGESLGQLRIEGSATWAGDIILAEAITGAGDGHVGAASGTGTISGSIGETGGTQGLVKDGDGTTVLSGANTYTGPTSANDGILLINSPGSIAAGSAVTVNSGARVAGSGIINGPVTVASGGTLGGSLTLNGPVTVAAGGTLDATDSTLPSLNATSILTLGGFLDMSIDRSRVPKASNLTITGNLLRGGTLRVLNTGPELQLGDSFILTISAGSVSGAFSSTLLPALGYGLSWNTSQLATNGTITVVANTGFTASTTTLTPATTYQQIHGIGANFCLGPQSIAWNNSQFNLAFSPANLNISFVRLANSFECALDEPDIFWSGWDSDNVRFIEMYRAIQPNGLITMSAWSPPGRFKSTGSAMGGTLAKNASNQYRYADYADWWLRSLQYLRDNSTLPAEKAIPDFISIQNEADFTPGGTFYAAWQAGCYLNGTETSTKAGYPQAFAAVKTSLQSNGFGFVKFIGPDTTTGGASTISGYLNNLPGGSLAAIAHHPYQGSTNDVGHVTGSLSGLRAAYPTSTIYMTEFFGDDSYGAGVPDWMMHALPIHNIFTIEQANTYLMWGLSLTPTSGSFCALGQYSKFINPGDWRAAATTTDANVAVSLYRHTVAAGVPERLILVMINKSASYSYQTVQTSDVWASDPARRTWKVYKTADDGSTQQRITLTEDLAGAALTGNRNLVLAPYSITTILINSDAPLSNQETWRQQYFGTAANLGNAADSFDFNGDGESNLYEFATNQDPSANTRVTPTMVRNGANLEFTYTRSKAAVADGLTFTVEWSDTLETGSWSTAGIPDQDPAPIAQDAETETLGIAVPSGTSGKRFVRLKVAKP
jgi:autotransporter-associated beta strand protein